MQKKSSERIFMNTRVEISIISSKGTVYIHEKIEEAFEKFNYVVKKLSRFDKQSELSALNKNSGKKTQVSKELFNLIEYVVDLAILSKGKFDPTILDVLELYGFKNKNNFKELENPALLKKIKGLLKNRKSYKEIKLQKEASSVTLKQSQKIDLGSIGKGYAIDLASKTLDEFESFMINAGGDIKVKGINEQKKLWNIGLHKAQAPNKKLPEKDIFGSIELNNKSICSSGGWERRYKFFHHLIDTATGFPKYDVSQTFVIADKAIDADAWSTLLFVMGPDGLKLIEEKKDMEGLIIMTNQKILKTKGFTYASI